MINPVEQMFFYKSVRVLAGIDKNPKLSLYELADKCNITYSYFLMKVKFFAKHDLLTYEKIGRKNIIVITIRGKKFLKHYYKIVEQLRQ